MNDFDDGEGEPRRRGSRRAKPARRSFEPAEPGSLEADAAREAALRILTRTSKSVAELEQALIKKGATNEVAAGVAERFIEVQLLDDSKLAQAIVKTRVALKGESARAIRRELDRRGLSAHAESALIELDRDSELENATQLAADRLRRMNGLARETQMRRLSSFLARKGYSGDVIGKAIRSAEAQAKIDF